MKAAWDKAPAGPKKDAALKHYQAAEKANTAKNDAETNKELMRRPPPSRNLRRLNVNTGAACRAREGGPLISVAAQSGPDIPDRTRQVYQPTIVVKRNAAVRKGDQSTLAKLPQDAVHMDRAQTQRIGEVVLRHEGSRILPCCLFRPAQASIPVSSRKCAIRGVPHYADRSRPDATRPSLRPLTLPRSMAVARRGVRAKASIRSSPALRRPRCQRWVRSCDPKCATGRCAIPENPRHLKSTICRVRRPGACREQTQPDDRMYAA